MKNGNRKLSKYQKIISKFCKEPATIWAHPTLIKREMKIAKKLFTLKSQKFWEEAHLPFKLNSLAWLLGKDGKEYIKKEELQQKMPVTQHESHELEKDKIGEDKKISFKPSTLMEFLNGKRK